MYKAAKANHADEIAKREVEALNQSFDEDRAGRRCPVINPYDRRIQWWDSMVLAFLCFQAVEMPFRLAFDKVFYTSSGLFACRWVEFLMDVSFLIDLVGRRPATRFHRLAYACAPL